MIRCPISHQMSPGLIELILQSIILDFFLSHCLHQSQILLTQKLKLSIKLTYFLIVFLTSCLQSLFCYFLTIHYLLQILLPFLFVSTPLESIRFQHLLQSLSFRLSLLLYSQLIVQLSLLLFIQTFKHFISHRFLFCFFTSLKVLSL